MDHNLSIESDGTVNQSASLETSEDLSSQSFNADVCETLRNLDIHATSCRLLDIQSVSKTAICLALCAMAERETTVDRAIFNAERNLKHQEEMRGDLEKRCGKALREAENAPVLISFDSNQHIKFFANDKDSGDKENIRDIVSPGDSHEQIRSVLNFRGYSEEIDLDNLEKLKEKIRDLQRKRNALKEDLQQKYRGLPANMKEARAVFAAKAEELSKPLN
ncbi:uncharacterized protein LOC129580685 [Paramacrobiotus metropolitanus]|uniref:uncharacterized protein LOC129580685 n=1 Tax=Paramacrobiotus metropolitanus TaxID=2943436 RepID=UPI00244642A6|nr:uncharacterized protein LOC129580685 [Paramacrobiotus metropolitanus]XP_055327304.1 uncharacterized protein LOC129580685 [Paramacrobiotus metropolitanus]XP_055327305.1 uncharacterized protein LOC129580685 [Paramacrobiotus metropolitanus]XP_055327306.1 uncharacterized protein LOC129580685 [Paramacrobiotus metropolitanus]